MIRGDVHKIIIFQRKSKGKGVKSLVVHSPPEGLGRFSRGNQGQIYFLSSFLGRPRMRRVSCWPMIPASSAKKVSEPIRLNFSS